MTALLLVAVLVASSALLTVLAVQRAAARTVDIEDRSRGTRP